MAQSFSLIDLIPDVATINIVDIGAMSLGSGKEPYASLLSANKARVIGFEPNPEECERLNKLHGEPHRFYPYFIGDGADAPSTKPTGPRRARSIRQTGPCSRSSRTSTN